MNMMNEIKVIKKDLKLKGITSEKVNFKTFNKQEESK